MLTYVINTSENKTFDSDILFKLVDYNKICWMECTLDKLSTCAEEIYDRQNTLEADTFRVAVIVDFYGFDRLRRPYGINGYGEETLSVDISIYIQYIEAYIYDNLYALLENKEVIPNTFEVYYIQNSKYEEFDLFENMEEQVRYVLTPHGESVEIERKEKKSGGTRNYKKSKDEEEDEESKPEVTETLEPAYQAFKLYCTEALSLDFRITDYPYTADKGMTLTDFIHSFYIRASIPTKIIRHHYVTEFGTSPVSAAFDTLSLSFHLIKTYERELKVGKELDLEIKRIKKDVLRETLITAWRKVHSAMDVAKSSNAKYYSFKNYTHDEDAEEEDEKDRLNERAHDSKLRNELRKEYTTPEEQYARIKLYANHLTGELDEGDVQIIEKTMAEYFVKRDNSQLCDEEETDADKNEMTSACPSNVEYEHAVRCQQNKVSKLLDKAIKAERVQVDYSKEKERADSSFIKYVEAKSLLSKNTLVDLLVCIFTIIIALVPYFCVQLSHNANATPSSIVIAILSALCFGGLYLLTVFFKSAPIVAKLNKSKNDIFDTLAICKAKQELSNASLIKRYNSDLIELEETKFTIRKLAKFHERNLAVNSQVKQHREMLEAVENSLSGMLNNLGVEPEADRYESVEGEFYLDKSFKSSANKVYHIFSIEAIENMFSGKESK